MLQTILAETNGTFFSVKIIMAMEMIGFFVKLSCSLLWFQIYRLGASIIETSLPHTNSDLRNRFLNPQTSAIDMRCSCAEEMWGGSVYDLPYYTFLFEEIQTNMISLKLYLYGKGAHISSFQN
ncbi:hypothetical protein Bca52824_002219 [Brassica carinata]|uniref:Uncharacterized protein n=1 Tax=Brassica carinata TaxID=52824 RepID=A0A8X7WJS4_BRACI|nr:hypothetical protein Bca52824_002219 [Brassica carinata]